VASRMVSQMPTAAMTVSPLTVSTFTVSRSVARDLR
jgi:hypothetical protein